MASSSPMRIKRPCPISCIRPRLCLRDLTITISILYYHQTYHHHHHHHHPPLHHPLRCHHFCNLMALLTQTHLYCATYPSIITSIGHCHLTLVSRDHAPSAVSDRDSFFCFNHHHHHHQGCRFCKASA